MRGTWQTTDSGGGSGLGTIVLVILAAALLGPAVTAAVAELLHIVLIIVAVLAGLGAAGVAALVGVRVWRWHVNHPQHPAVPAPPRWRPGITPPEPPEVASEPPPRAIGRPMRLHAVTAEDLDELARRRRQDGQS